MARKARIYSQSGCYHIVIKGVGNQILFEDDNDCRKFLFYLKKFKKQMDVKIIGFCLMENHVHLILRTEGKLVSRFMQKLEISYAYYFNVKYQREGPVFNGRFKSEPIENDVYMLTAFRYVVRNPEKAGICRFNEYLWSSFSEIYAAKDSKKVFSVTDTDIISSFFENESDFMRFLNITNDKNSFIDLKKKAFFHMDDEMAKDFVHTKLNLKTAVLIKGFERKKRNLFIEKMRMAGMSIRQIERLSGIGRGIIQRIKVLVNQP